MNSNLIKLDPGLLCKKTKELEDFLFERIINQPRAVRCVVSAYDKFNSPLWRYEKPMLAALFLGPSGVGKTYIAEMLAEYFFDDPAAFTKIECANYVERHEISKLLGAPPGYLGYNEPPLLSQRNIEMPAIQHAKMTLIKTDTKARWLNKEVEKARQKCLKSISNDQIEAKSLIQAYTQKVEEFQNYVFEKIKDLPLISIILFDEIEKANPSLHNFLLEVTSKGRTHLGNGQETLFYNSFIFMTSNIGYQAIADFLRGKRGMGFSSDKTIMTGKDPIYEDVMAEVRKTFDPAFLGRIEENIVVFKPLSKEKLNEIMNLQITAMITALNKTYPVKLEIDECVKNFILEKASDHPEYGARLLNDKIDKYIKKPLARLINSGQILKGDEILINLENDQVVFSKYPSVKILDSVFEIPVK